MRRRRRGERRDRDHRRARTASDRHHRRLTRVGVASRSGCGSTAATRPTSSSSTRSPSSTRSTPTSKVTFERQQWTGIVEKLTTSLSSSDSPDVDRARQHPGPGVRGRRRAAGPHATSASLGGDDLLQSLVEAGTYDGKFYGVPYYAGARVVLYRKDLFEASGLEVPTTIDEMLAAGDDAEGRQRRRRRTSRASTCPARTGTPRCRSSGSTAATSPRKDGDAWIGELDSPESVAGLDALPAVRSTRPTGAERRRRRQGLPRVLQRRGRHDAGAGLEARPDHQPRRRLPRHGGQHRRLRDARPRPPARRRRCSSVARTSPSPANSENQELAYDLLKILVSTEYQKQFADQRHDPGAQVAARRQSAAARRAVAQAKAAENSRFVPTSENWAGVEAANILPDMLVAIAQGADIAGGSRARRRGDRGAPQRLTLAPDRTRAASMTVTTTVRRSASPPPIGARRRRRRRPPAARPSRRRRGRRCPTCCSLRRSSSSRLMLGYPLVRLVVLSLQEFGLQQQFGAPADWVGLDNFRADLYDDPYFWTVLRRTVHVLLRQRGADDGARHARSPCC